MTAYHNGNQFIVQYHGPKAVVGFGPFTISKAHEFMGAMREATGAPATAFGVLRTALVDSRLGA